MTTGKIFNQKYTCKSVVQSKMCLKNTTVFYRPDPTTVYFKGISDIKNQGHIELFFKFNAPLKAFYHGFIPV